MAAEISASINGASEKCGAKSGHLSEREREENGGGNGRGDHGE